jgi:hypothetical protein
LIGRVSRLRLLAGVAVAGLALSNSGLTFAQTAPPPTLGSWLSGPDGQGSSTIVGRIESPRANQNINTASNLLVSGWAADTTATGWAGIDGVEVWSGTKDKGTKLATGSPGLPRTDVGDALGNSFNTAGFTAVVPSSALSPLTANATTLYVYLHTPNKGTWYRTVGIALTSAATLAYPNDPIIWVAKPQDGTAVTQKQKFSKFTFSGVALDRNPITDPKTQNTGPGCAGCGGATGAIGTSARGAGIASINAYIDTPPAKGDTTIFGSFGAPCGGCLYGTPLVSNTGVLNTPLKRNGSIISRQYGSQFDYSGWSIAINPTLLAPGPHTLFVTATSSITGKQSTAQVTFNILDLSHTKIQP